MDAAAIDNAIAGRRAIRMRALDGCVDPTSTRDNEAARRIPLARNHRTVTTREPEESIRRIADAIETKLRKARITPVARSPRLLVPFSLRASAVIMPSRLRRADVWS